MVHCLLAAETAYTFSLFLATFLSLVFVSFILYFGKTQISNNELDKWVENKTQLQV